MTMLTKTITQQLLDAIGLPGGRQTVFEEHNHSKGRLRHSGPGDGFFVRVTHRSLGEMQGP